MVEGDVLKSELLAGFERGVQRKKDDFENPIMLNSGSHNRNDTKADGYLVGTPWKSRPKPIPAAMMPGESLPSGTYPNLKIGPGLVICASKETRWISENIMAVPWQRGGVFF
jgi:hypothetical protein